MKAALIFSVLVASPGAAQVSGDVFADAANNAKIHVASGFVCPSKIGLFDRDAVGERDPKASSDFCAYSALDGVYGTIVLTPLKGPYDPKTALVPDFMEQEGTGGHMIAEGTTKPGPNGVGIYTRTYETTNLESLHYRIQFAASAVGQWAVEVTTEYASPRDDVLQQQFLDAVYGEAFKKIAGTK